MGTLKRRLAALEGCGTHSQIGEALDALADGLPMPADIDPRILAGLKGLSHG